MRPRSWRSGVMFCGCAPENAYNVMLNFRLISISMSMLPRLTRRQFMATASALAFAGDLFSTPKDSRAPSPDLEKLGAVALAEARKYRATYCDVRIVRLRNQQIALRLSPDRDTGQTLAVPNVSESSSFGFGVRVIVNGAWGFASSPLVTKEEIARVTGEAVVIAKANATIQPSPVQLCPVKAYRDRWDTPHEKDPFAVEVAEKLELLQMRRKK